MSELKYLSACRLALIGQRLELRTTDDDNNNNNNNKDNNNNNKVSKTAMADLVNGDEHSLSKKYLIWPAQNIASDVQVQLLAFP